MERWSPFRELRRLQEDFAQLMGELERSWLPRMRTGEPVERWLKGPVAGTSELREPHMDVIEREDEIVVSVELPGVKKEDIDLTIADNVLRVKAKREEEVEKREENYLYRERTYRGYHRAIPLPVDVDADRAEATFKNGVLEVRLPKVAAEKVSKIDVK